MNRKLQNGTGGLAKELLIKSPSAPHQVLEKIRTDGAMFVTVAILNDGAINRTKHELS